MSGRLYGAAAAVTLTADGPFCPSWISNSTASFSASVLNPCFWMALKWTKTSFEPSLGEMKPKPLVSLNHLTCPLILFSDILTSVWRKIAAGFGGVGYACQFGAFRRRLLDGKVKSEWHLHDDLARGWYFKGVKYCRDGALIMGSLGDEICGWW